MNNCNKNVNRCASLKDLNNYFKINDLLGGLTASQQDQLRSNIGTLRDYIFNNYINLTDVEITKTLASYDKISSQNPVLSNKNDFYYFIINLAQSRLIERFYIEGDDKLKFMPDVLYLPNAIDIVLKNLTIQDFIGIDAPNSILNVTNCSFISLSASSKKIIVDNCSNLEELIGSSNSLMQISNCPNLVYINGLKLQNEYIYRTPIINCPNVQDINFVPDTLTFSGLDLSELKHLTSNTIDNLIDAMKETSVTDSNIVYLHEDVIVTDEQRNAALAKKFTFNTR